MAGYGILRELSTELRILTEQQISKSVSKELSVYAKEKKKLGKDTALELAKYEAILREKYTRKNAELEKELDKKRLEDEAKYSKTSLERLAAKKKLIETEIQDIAERRETQREDAKLRKAQSRLALEEAQNKKNEEALKRAAEATLHNVELLGKMPGKAMQAMTKGVGDYIGAFSRYFTQIEVGLLGTGRGFDSAKSLIDRVVGINPAVKQTQVLENLQAYIGKGIIRDAELRATIATVGSKISNTFNSLDPTLLSLTKIMREDVTMARLGMETSLSRYMGREYQDTSYFANNTNEYVSSQLLQAMSQMGLKQAMELEYTVQKWLGSFVSVGVSEETAKKIAEGVGYIASGNIQGLTSNNALTNLIVSAANKGGVDLGTVFQQGAKGSDIDNLMRGLYTQVKEIAESGNQVVRSQYAGLYGMSISDITAMQNLTQDKIMQNLAKNMRAGEMEQLTKDEMNKAWKRVATSQVIENAMENIMSMVGEKLASSPAMHVTWKLAEMVTQAGGIRLPGVLAVGSGMAQLPDVDQILKAGLLTTSVIGTLPDIIASLGRKGGFDLSKFKDIENISSKSSLEQSQIGRLAIEEAVASNAGATFIGDTDKSNLYQSSMAQIQDLVKLTGQDENLDEKGATSNDIDRLIRTIEEEGRKNRGEYTILNNGPLATIKWG